MDLGGLLELAGHELFGLLDFGEAVALDANGGYVGHDGEQVEIVAGELAGELRRIDVDEADHLVVGLERNCHEGAHAMLDDAEALAEGLIHGDIANHHGGLGVEHAVAHGATDTEAFALGCLRDELSLLERHEDAAARTDRLGGQIEDHGEQFGERAAGGQFASGAEKGRNGAAPLGRERGLVFGLALQEVFERGADGLLRGTGENGPFEEDGLVGVDLGGVVHQDDAAGDDAVPGVQAHRAGHSGAVEKGAVLAAEVAEYPDVAVALDGHVLARKADIIGKAEFVGAGTAEREALALQAGLGGGPVR